MKKRFGFFAFLSVILVCWGGGITSCKSDSGSSGPAELDLTMYKDSKCEDEIEDDTLIHEIKGEDEKSPYFYVQSLNYPNKNDFSYEEGFYEFDGDEVELEDGDVTVGTYKARYKCYKVTLANFPQKAGSYDYTLSFSAKNGEFYDLGFTLKVNKTNSGGLVSGSGPKIDHDLDLSYSGATSVTLNISASVPNETNPQITYQWYKNNEKITGANESSYTAEVSGAYYVKVTANNQDVISHTANVTIGGGNAPMVTIKASPYEIKNGEVAVPTPSSVTLSVSVDSSGDLYEYEWFKSDLDSSGSDENLSISTSSCTPNDFARYYCKVKVNGTTLYSSNVNVVEKDIVVNIKKNFGEESYVNVELTVTPETDVPCTFEYKWCEFEDENSAGSITIPGATSESYIPTKEGWYECYVRAISKNTNTKTSWKDAGKCYVRNKTGNDPEKPNVSDPTGTTSLQEGGTLRLSVTASTADKGTLSYQWLKDSNIIAGATSATYVKENVTTSDAGKYSCRVFNTLNGHSMDADSSQVQVRVQKRDSETGSGDVGFDFN